MISYALQTFENQTRSKTRNYRRKHTQKNPLRYMARAAGKCPFVYRGNRRSLGILDTKELERACVAGTSVIFVETMSFRTK